jgi:O6-methylguanine-DNA--protein-cysteine methyltransferase
VIESDGKLGGFAPGKDIKRRLLQMEFYRLREE